MPTCHCISHARLGTAPPTHAPRTSLVTSAPHLRCVRSGVDSRGHETPQSKTPRRARRLASIPRHCWCPQLHTSSIAQADAPAVPAAAATAIAAPTSLAALAAAITTAADTAASAARAASATRSGGPWSKGRRVGRWCLRRAWLRHCARGAARQAAASRHSDARSAARSTCRPARRATWLVAASASASGAPSPSVRREAFLRPPLRRSHE